jgi:hypothetical protein
VIQGQFLIAGVDGLDGLLQIVARDIRTDYQDLAGIDQYVGGIGIGEARPLGAADHVHVQVGNNF